MCHCLLGKQMHAFVCLPVHSIASCRADSRYDDDNNAQAAAKLQPDSHSDVMKDKVITTVSMSWPKTLY